MRHGSHIDPPNRFERVSVHEDFEQLDGSDEQLTQPPRREIEYLPDQTQSIVTQNDSPDIPFRYSINPYRGCVHACAYCYARNTHEYLGFNAGLDFETKIMVKHNAPALLREHLNRKSWRGETIVFSGVTDCYQPGERQYRLTQGCLQVALEYQQSIGIITKNALVLRDLSLLTEFASWGLVSVYFSINSLDVEFVRQLEPRTSIPTARLRAVEQLADAGIPVGVMVAPIIPGLNDDQIPQVLQAAKNAGARAAGYILLRLPLTVRPVFEEWLQRTYPNRAEKVLGQLRQMRGGELNESQFKQRMVGHGPLAEHIRAMFKLFQTKLGLAGRLPEQDTSRFAVPKRAASQLRLFD